MGSPANHRPSLRQRPRKPKGKKIAEALKIIPGVEAGEDEKKKIPHHRVVRRLFPFCFSSSLSFPSSPPSSYIPIQLFFFRVIPTSLYSKWRKKSTMVPLALIWVCRLKTCRGWVVLFEEFFSPSSSPTSFIYNDENLEIILQPGKACLPFTCC